MATLQLPETNTEVSSPTEPKSQLTALLGGAGIATLDDIGWLRVTGEDRVRWLNGMTTNSIQELPPGQGCYNFFLSAQGRIQGDAYAFAEPDGILLETSLARLPALTGLLDRFIIMDDVELVDISAGRAGLLCAGPKAAAALASIGIETGSSETGSSETGNSETGSASPLTLSVSDWRAQTITIIHAHSPLVPRFELFAGPGTVAAITSALVESGAIPCSPASLEHLRMLEGTPRYGVDIRDRELPQETGQTRALHFAKGCYLGQEIVERIRSRGNVHRVFHAFKLTGDLAAAGMALESGGKPVGEITSVASISLVSGTIQIALGYIRREALDRADIIICAGGEASPIATPFHSAERNT